jgi:DNA segregation ATPase FtsK/SpoIIIE-like protein
MSGDDLAKSIEELKTELVGLKIRLRRIEDFLHDFPSASDYFTDSSEFYEDAGLIEDAIKLVVQYDRASAALLQRRLSIGYARAARIIDILERKQVVGPADGSKPREVLIYNAEEFLAREAEGQAADLPESGDSFDSDEPDDLFKDAVIVVCQAGTASMPLLQRRLSVGYARAARLIDQLEKAGAIGPTDGSKPREVLISSPEELFSGQTKNEGSPAQ